MRQHASTSLRRRRIRRLSRSCTDNDEVYPIAREKYAAQSVIMVYARSEGGPSVRPWDWTGEQRNLQQLVELQIAGDRGACNL